MTLRDALDFALTSLRGNLAKSLLTVLGLGVGVGAVLTVLSLGDAGEIRVEEEIARLGVDKVWFCAENPAYPLTEDCRVIAASTGADVCLGASTMDAVSLGGQTVYAQIAGYDDGLETVHHPGRMPMRLPQQNWRWPSRRAKRRGNWLRMFWRSCTICRENISP